MGEVRYTLDPAVNDQVSKVIETLKQELVTHFHPKSIVLAGSLGRGEATIIATNQGMEFRSDAEVIIIPNWHIFTQGKLERFCEHFCRRTGLKVSISGVMVSLNLLLPFMARNLKPTIGNYDLKYGSRTIYGKDYLKRIGNLRQEDIPAWEGIRLLFNRMVEALELFTPEAGRDLVYRIDKIALACQDALLLLMHKYDPSYEKRNKMFKQVFPKHFAGLEEKVPNLLPMAEEAARRKLSGNTSVGRPLELWFDTAAVCDPVFRYVIEKEMGIVIEDYLGFQKEYMANPKLGEYIRLPFGSTACQNTWSSLRLLLVNHALPSLRLVAKPRTRWAHLVYSIIPLVYFSWLRGDEIIEQYLSRALDIIASIEGKKMKYSSSLEGWEYAQNWVVNYWHKMCW